MSEASAIARKRSPGRIYLPTSARLSDDVYSKLKKDILSASLKSDDRLYETTVAEAYGGSRTPVREALLRLLEEGLLVRQGRAYIVSRISVSEMIDIYRVRQNLECLSASIAAESITDAALGELRAMIEAMRIAAARREGSTFNLLDSEFHLAIAKSTGNEVLMDILTKLHERVLLVRNSVERFLSRLENANQEHEAIYNAIRRGQPTIASAEMNSHIQSTIESLRTSGIDLVESKQL
ncbi:putative Transcriptional regulator, GntR family [Mesorhizobium plurifarium]|uniref:Putative Transcriptional regulator, GntR family n=1 Tax=Mesorhizobium plurifarium TaxID=69974 RepID=A0A090EWG3_MESPL|nr:putative Transcriptional regulator, GntR family [Mesorhizobium plurifarium]